QRTDVSASRLRSSNRWPTTRWTPGPTCWLPGNATRLPDSGLHFLTPEYPPANGGVADYTRLLAGALAKQLGTVHVWAPRVTGSDAADDGIVVHRIAGFDPRSLEEIGMQLEALPGPRRLFLQYVPTSFGFRGMNVPLTRWLRGRSEKLWIQVQEGALGWTLWRKPPLHLVHAVQLWMAAALARRADRIFVSIEAWKQRLGEQAGRAVWLPIPSNIPAQVEPGNLDRARRSLGGGPGIAHFGTYCPLIVSDPRPASGEIGRLRPDARFLLLGRGALDFGRKLGLAERIDVREDLPASEIAALLKASTLVLQPFPDGISARRTSAMAGL